MRSKSVASLTLTALLVGGLVLLTGCSPDEEKDPVETTKPASGDSAAWKISDLEEAVFESGMKKDEVIGSASGNLVYHSSNANPAVTVEVNAVTATKTATIIDFTVKSKDPKVLGDMGAFNAKRPMADDVRDIAIIAPGENKRYLPFLATRNNDPDTSICACSDSMTLLDDTHGRFISGIFPPLDEKEKTISLELAGLPVIENLPVTRE